MPSQHPSEFVQPEPNLTTILEEVNLDLDDDTDLDDEFIAPTLSLTTWLATQQTN